MAMKVGELEKTLVPPVNRIRICRPDDFHVHLRDGVTMECVVGATAKVFGRALIMPNLKPPVTTSRAALLYRGRILRAMTREQRNRFNPLMTLYLTDKTSLDEIQAAANCNVLLAVKYYPAGATTNSDQGVTDIWKTDPVLDAMQKAGIVLCIHGEVTDPAVDIFDREVRFIERVLMPLRAAFPELRIVLEHVTTKEGVDYVMGSDQYVAATITPQHLLFNRNALFAGGLRPHHWCLPVLKREEHRRALVLAATSGSPKFFLGTDSAPHERGTKETTCGCAGCFSAPIAMSLYAEVFESVGALDRLEGFASHFGAKFYGLPRNEGTITLERKPFVVPEQYPFGAGVVVPLCAGETLEWQVVQS